MATFLESVLQNKRQRDSVRDAAFRTRHDVAGAAMTV
jgi:hypothetical protein